MFRKLLWMLKEPGKFFEGVRQEGYREPFVFLLQVSAVIAFFTPIVNYLGWGSTDRTSTYQAQILGWQSHPGLPTSSAGNSSLLH
ncbi:MAG: hypothetical protein WBW48_22940 [Anaerolineae bacterium]